MKRPRSKLVLNARTLDPRNKLRGMRIAVLIKLIYKDKYTF